MPHKSSRADSGGMAESVDEKPAQASVKSKGRTLKSAAKYHIKSAPAESRREPVGKFTIERAEHCTDCGLCMRVCLYGVHERDPLDRRKMARPKDYLCRNCFRCVQECPMLALSMDLSQFYASMGRGIYTPDVIHSLAAQAERGQIPVQGAGYRGPFSGPGFDGMWTDMSEIVRPTRDGIHGREYISTAAMLGARPERLTFDAEGGLQSVLPPTVEIPFPVLFDVSDMPDLAEVALHAARQIGTLALTNDIEVDPALFPSLAVHATSPDEIPDGARLVIVDDRALALNLVAGLPRAVVGLRMRIDERATDQIVELIRMGIPLIYLVGEDGTSLDPTSDVPDLVRALPAVHEGLVEEGIRDRVTLVVRGSIAQAEHLPKAMILGADAVAIDWPLLVALECRLEGSCVDGAHICGLASRLADREWAVQRVVNLMASWHSQFLEVLGAMGLREARRLRGERGRAMFADHLEAASFEGIVRVRSSAPNGEPATAELGPDDKLDFEAEVVHQPPARLRHRIGPWTVDVSRDCTECGLCVEVCPADVFHFTPRRHRLAVSSEHCLGPSCNLCVQECPAGAITISPNSNYAALGNKRWTNDLLAATFHAAEHGVFPDRAAVRYDIGDSGGGFDRLHFNFPETVEPIAPAEIDTSIPLNRRGEGREISIAIPVYGGGMSFGSVSLNVMLARAVAAKRLGTFTCTGEGGYPTPLFKYADHIITQVATGLFGVREETIQVAPIVEFKYAQGAKPGLGGHLLSDKVTRAVAHVRGAVEGTSLFSPFPFHSVYSVEDHKKHVDWIKTINPHTLIAVKVSTPEDVDMVAVGSYYAGAHIIHLDGAYGGTGAAPEIAKKNIAMPIEFAIPRAHRFLEKEGIRDKVTLIASGGIRTPHDVLKAIMLGADGCVIGTAELVALGCVHCGNCESGRGCPLGIATTDPELAPLIEPKWGAQRIVNMYVAWHTEWVRLMRKLGARSVRELRGRTDLLAYEEGI